MDVVEKHTQAAVTWREREGGRERGREGGREGERSKEGGRE